MNQKLQDIFHFIQQSEKLDAEQKENLLKAVKDADKELEITAFKLERTEKVKKTTAILLEETIEELEQKRKAVEEQNRELEIEASLERVRAVAMGMNKSDDLLSICEVSFKEFKNLGFDNIRNSLIHIQYDEQKCFMDYDFSDLTGGAITNIEYGSHPVVEDYLEQINSAKDAFYQGVIKEDQLEEWKNFRRNSGQIDDPRLENATALYYYFFSIGIGDIGISTLQPIDESQIKILKRFRNVFDLAYRRYNDIALAEAQARETQIQLALERVRARTMAMHKSEELSETTFILFQQFVELGVVPNRFFIGTMNEEETTFDVWITEWGGKMSSQNFKVNIEEPLQWKKVYKAWKAHDRSLVVDINGEELIKWNEYLEGICFPVKTRKSVTRVVNTFAIFSNGFIAITTPESTSIEIIQLLERFADVFNLTYRRFLDLKKAEAQAREAQIETALERVRSKAMAMHNSQNLLDTINEFFVQLKILNIIPVRCGVAQMFDNPPSWTAAATNATIQGDSVQLSGKVEYLNHPVLKGIYDHWVKQENYFPVLQGEEIKKYYKALRPQINVPEFPEGEIHHGHYFSFREGNIFAWTKAPLSEDEKSIFVRFSSVLSLTYRRYLDLKESETQVREAQIEAALERVRAKTMAMHKSDELADTAAVVFQQLINLGIEPNRIYIAIIKDEKGDVVFWITNEDGSKVSSGFEANLNDNISFQKMLYGWNEKKKSITIDMQGKELQEYFSHLTKLGVPFKGGLSQKRRLQYIAYFSKGFIGVASPDETKPETLQLLERFAAVFNLTYTRFNDLLRAEAQNRIIQAENERKTKELEEARQLQLSLLPRELPKLPNLDIAVYMKTATEVGGDYYDFNVQENGVLDIGFGDATGHGLQAGTMITLMKGFFTSDASRFTPQKFLEHCNRMIRDIKLGRILMSFTHLRFERKSLMISSAGMPPIYYNHKENNRTEEIMIQGLPLGALQNTSYNLVVKELKSGDTILLLTDGLPEQMNSRKVIFDYSRVLKYFDEIAENTPKEIMNKLVKKAEEWIDGQQQGDDITFVVIKVL